MLFAAVEVKFIIIVQNVDNSGNSDSFFTAMLFNKKNKELAMMRRMLLVAAVGMFFLSGNLSAVSMYQSLQNHIVGCGQTLDTINLPLFGKLTNLIPFGMIAACLQEHPGQMTIVLAGLLAYVLSQNESVRSILSQYNVPGFAGSENDQMDGLESDDTLFVFDGEDDEDAQEEIDTEDELLQEDLLNEEYNLRNKKLDAQPTIKFL